MRTNVFGLSLAGCAAVIACGGNGGSTSATSEDAGADSGVADATFDVFSDAGSEAGQEGLAEGAAEAAPLVDAPEEALPDALDGPVSCGWTPYNTGLSGGVIADVLFDTRTTPPSLFATGGNSLFRSSDNGATWSTRGTFGGGITYLALPTNNPSLLLASSSSGVIQSTNSGQTWSVLAFQNVNVHAIAVAPSDPLRLYVGVSGGGAYRSDDQGTSWSAVNQGYPFVDTVAIDVAADNPDEVLAGGQLLNAQGGWAANGVLERTTDGGQSWQTVIQNDGHVLNVRRCSVNNTILYAATGNSVARSSDRGATWTFTALSNQVVDVAITPGVCNDLYAMVYGVGPEHSTDGGQTFGTPLTQGLDLAPPDGRMAIASRPAVGDASAVEAGGGDASMGADQSIILGSHGGIWYTTNGGTQWGSSQGVLGMSIRSLMTSPLDPGHLWLASFGSGVWHRPSPTQSWQRVPTTELPVDYALMAAPDPHTANRVLFGTAPTFYESTDDGVTLTATSLQEDEFSFAFDPTNASVLYAATQVNGVYKSTDGGTTWATSNGGLVAWTTASGTFIDVRSIVVDPSSPQTVYIGTNGAGVQKSTDGGGSWSNVLSPTGEIGCLVVVPGAPSVVYACVAGSGVESSSDGGSTWTDASQGLTSQDVNGLVYDGTTGGLYATTTTGAYANVAGQGWSGIDVACTPGNGAGTPAIVVSGSSRSVVISSAGGVYAHPI